MLNRGCTFAMANGVLCQASAIRGGRLCYQHDPDHAEQAAEARRLGGFRRHRERSLGIAYDVGGVRTVEDFGRILDVALFDLLGSEASIGRAKALVQVVLAGIKVRDAGDLEARLVALEAAHRATTSTESALPEEAA